MKSDRTIPFGHLREAQTEVPPDREALPRNYLFCPLMRPEEGKATNKEI